MNSWAITDKGIVRKQNQDAFFAYCDESREFAVLIVCDGMGGANAGNIASKLATETFIDKIKSGFAAVEGEPDIGEIEDIVKDAAMTANTVVFKIGSTSADYYGMGTTLVAVVVYKDITIVANIGDSRAYHIAKSGIKQITRDHSVVEDMIERGDITRAEARIHPNKNLITRALGTGARVGCDIFYPHLGKDEFILLCSDGLSNMVNEQEMLYEVLHGDSLENSCEKMLSLCLVRGAPDNITMILFRK